MSGYGRWVFLRFDLAWCVPVTVSEIPTPNPPDGAKFPQYDFVVELERLREANRAITIDGPAGLKFKAVIDGMLRVMLDVL